MNDLRGPDWRATAPTSAARRWPHPLAVVLGVSALVAVGLVLLWWVQPVRPAAVVCVSASSSADGSPVPFASADFARLTGPPLRPSPFALPQNPTRDQLRTALAGLGRHPADQPLVVFLSGAATVTANDIELAAGVVGADHARNRVTLTEVLEQVRAARTPHKLVVLDLHTPHADWVAMATKRLEFVGDPRRLALFAHGKGEVSHASHDRGGAVFVRYWVEGLRGAADGYNPDGATDKRVSVNELAAFVRSRTVRWTERNRTVPQTPWLTGDGTDFVLTTAGPRSTEEPEPTADPTKMLEAWAIRDVWLTEKKADRAPVEFARLEHALLTMERNWRAGQSPNAVRSAFDAELAKIDRDAAVVLAPGVPDTLLPILPADPTQVETLRRYLTRNEAVAEPTEKPPAVTAPVVLAAASSEPSPTALQLKRLAKLLTDVEPDPAGLTSLLLKRVVAESVAPDRAAKLLRLTLEFERLSRLVGFFAWGRGGLDRAFAEWNTAVALACSPGFADPADADRALTALDNSLQSLGSTAEAHREAVAGLREGERARVKSNALDKLRASLAPPNPAPDLAALATAANTWAVLADEVKPATRAALAPFQLDALAVVRRRAEGSDAGPPELDALDAILAVPLTTAKERAALWAVRMALAKRLDDAVSDRDRQDDEDFATGRRSPEWTDPRVPPLPWARAAEPSPTVVTADSPPRNEFLAWHAGRFDHLARNPFDLPNAAAEVAFALKVVDQCRQFGATVPPSPRLEIQANGITLTPAERAKTVRVAVRLIGSEVPLTTAVDVHTPTPEWVTSSGGPVELSPVRAVVADRSLTVGSHPEKHPTLRGALVRSEVGGRAFFRRVDVDASSLANRLELLVASGVDGPTLPATALRVRPNGQPAKFTPILSNPTNAPQTVIVQLADPARETAPVTLLPGEKKPLVFPPLPPPAAPMPPATPPAPAAPVSEFAPAPAEFVLKVLDAKTRDVRQTFAVPVRVTEPADLLDVREVRYTPGGELVATIGERSTFAGGDMPVSLTFPTDRNRGLTVTDGKLNGTFASGQGTLKLYTKGLKFEPSAGRVVTLAISADGSERAFTFAGEASGDVAVRLQPLTDPRVQIRCEPFAANTVPLVVKLETDNAPPTATVEVLIGVDPDDAARTDFAHRKVPARDRTLGVAFDPKGGFSLKATAGDPEAKLGVEGLTGRRLVLARLLDANGKEIARDRRVVTFDGRRPQGVRFLDPPAKVPADKPLSVAATSDLPVSGVKEVHFFIGKVANDAPPPNAVLIPAKPVDGRNEWAASVPLDGAKGPLDVSVRFTSNAGLVGFATVTVERVDAAELNKPPALATIQGRVVVGELAQPGLVVVLFDDKNKPKAEATTKDDGTFAFPDLPAGKYSLFAQKTGPVIREKVLPVEVKAGEVKTVEVGLLLK